MKKILYTTILLFAFLGNISHAQYSLEYVPQFGMYLNQLCANGGPMYQSIKRRLDSIDRQRDIREQSVPIITRDEIRAFYREHELINQLRDQASRKGIEYLKAGNYTMKYHCNQAWHGLMKLGFAYSALVGHLEQFSALRPDAIR